MSGTCDHVTSHGKRDFADVMTVKDLEMDYVGGTHLITCP